MSGNSRASCLLTAPIVSALRPDGRSGSGCSPGARPGCGPSGSGRPAEGSVGVPISAPSALQVSQLVLAHLELVPVLQLVRLDPAAVDVGAVERAEVVEIEPVAPPHDQRVVARHRDVVEKHAGIGTTPDRHALALDRKALPRSPTA